MAAVQKATKPPLHLPLKRWRDQDGILYAAEASESPQAEEANPRALTLPVVLGSFEFELSKVTTWATN